MKVSTKELIFIKESIEKYTQEDSQITDVIINYQVKKNPSQQNFLKLDIKR
tara:strand:- start:244 stop:396 length:153 start_codon:yes stop_codon:yes gene_type:complete